MANRVLSTDPPTAVERAHEYTLDAWVASCIEPKEESDRRRTAVEQLLTICRSWIKFVMVTEFRLPASEDYGGKIFATGSYRHNVHSSGSDIDLVLFAPDRITRDHFFTSLVERIRGTRGVTDLTFTEAAVVPIISFKYDGVDIDLAFVSIRSTHVPDNFDFLDDKIHIGLDEFAVRSVNGVRDAQLLLNLVPNQAVFRTALRFVKHWSKRRAIYGAKLGFTSGIGWAILVAKVCQLYPQQNGAGLLVKFFKFCKSWFRPDTPNGPIYITPDLNPVNVINGLPKSWHPRNGRAESAALFPVITPAYPYQNSCYSVSRTTLETMLEEFAGALDFLTANMEATALEAQSVAKEAMRRLEIERQQQAAAAAASPKGSAATTASAAAALPPPSYGVWTTLLAPYNVFAHHQYFLHVAASCTSPKEYDSWADFVEAKIRFLWFEAAVNKGAAFECFRSVKLRVCSQRFEDPQQKDELKALKEAAKALAAAQAQRLSTGGVGAKPQLDDGVASPGGVAGSPRRLPGMASPGGNVSSTGVGATTSAAGAANSGGSSAKVFAAHYYFGFALVNGPSGEKPVPPNLIAIRSAFHKICDSNRPASATLPVVEIVKLKDLPKWLPDLPVATDGAPATTAAAAAGTTNAAAAGAPPSTSTATERRLRMEDDDPSMQQPARPQPTPTPVAATAPLAAVPPARVVTPTVAPKPAASVTSPAAAPASSNAAAADADELLGLDF